MLADKQPRDMLMHRTFHRNGAVLECEWYFSVLLDSAGKPLSINAQILDVTQRKRAEETRHLLIGELNHRVKNTLASVQARSEEHTSELQSLMRISYAVFCLKQKQTTTKVNSHDITPPHQI